MPNALKERLVNYRNKLLRLYEENEHQLTRAWRG